MSANAAPAGRQDQPEALAHLDDVLELADLERPRWPAMRDELHRSGVPLNEGEEDEEQEPTPEGEHSEEPGKKAGEDDPNQPSGEEESFTDFDLDSLPPEARGAAEAALKRMQADYTRKTQTAAEKAREAEQAQAILDGLHDPQRAPRILEILGVAGIEDEEFFDDEEDDELFTDPRVEELENRLSERERIEEVQAIEDAEDQAIAEDIEAFEEKHEHKFSKGEIELIYLYADKLPRDGQGRPDAKGAIDLLEGVIAERQQQWIASKKAPRRMRQGKAASRQVDLSTESQEDRVKRMAEAAEAARGSAE